MKKPFEIKRDNVIAITFHLIESLLLSAPILYEVFEASYIDNTFVWVVCLGLLIGILRFSFDVVCDRKTSSQVQSEAITTVKRNYFFSRNPPVNQRKAKENEQFIEQNIEEVKESTDSPVRRQTYGFSDAFHRNLRRNKESINRYTVVRRVDDSFNNS